MNVVFVSQENGRVPSGVVTAMRELIRHWDRPDRLAVLLNYDHGAAAFFERAFTASQRPAVTRVPFRLVPAPARWAQRHRALRLLDLVRRLGAAAALAPMRLAWLVGWLRRRDVEAVFSNNGGWPGGELNRWIIVAAWLAGVRYRVLINHNYPLPVHGLRRRYQQLWVGVLGKLATAIGSDSAYCARGQATEAGFREPVLPLPNGLGAEVPAAPDQGPPWPQERLAIGFIGGFEPRKGIEVLLEAAAQLSQPAELVLVGGGPAGYTQELRRRAGELLPDTPVHFLDFQEDLAPTYANLDVVVLPSLTHESYPLVLIEAMRYGIAVVCSDYGGMPEIVTDGESGLIVPAGDVDALARALERVLGDAALRRQLATGGQEAWRRYLSAPVMVSRYQALLAPPR